MSSGRHVETGAYEEWFKYHPENVGFVLDLLVVSLDDSFLAPEAAIALKSLCDLCRASLVKHVASFGQLHSKIHLMGVSSRTVSKKMIASAPTNCFSISQRHSPWSKQG